MTDAFHGLAPERDGATVHFGIALWPYDLLLRFGYDLPENEHTWKGKWFEDGFEAAAFDLRGTAAKLVLALAQLAAAEPALRRVAEGGPTMGTLAEARVTAEQAPLAVDLVVGYIRRLCEDIAHVIPCCYGLEGRVLLGARGSLQSLAKADETARLDPALADLLLALPLEAAGLVNGMGPTTHAPTLYVVSASAGYAAALPKMAARALRDSAALTVTALEALRTGTVALCRWLDRLLAHLQRVVAERSEPGPDLLERWARRDWSALTRLNEEDTRALSDALPVI